MANRRTGWRQARIDGPADTVPPSIRIVLTNSQTELLIPVGEMPDDCNTPGQKVWWRFSKAFQCHEVEVRE